MTVTVGAQKGNLFLVEVQNAGSPTTYSSLTSARTTSITVANSTVDVTTITSAGMRNLLQGAGISSLSMSVDGAVENSVQERALSTAAYAGAGGNFLNLKWTNGAGDMIIGKFAISSFKKGGTYNGEETFTATFDSAGTFTFTAAS